MSWLTIYFIFEWVLRIVLVLVVLRKPTMPSSKMSWLVVVMFLPEVGLFLYLILGVTHLGWRRKREHKYVLDLASTQSQVGMTEMMAKDKEKGGDVGAKVRDIVEPEQKAMVLQAQSMSGNPIVTGSDVQFIASSKRYVDLLVKDIDEARDHVHLLYYIFVDDDYGRRVVNALIRAEKRGVACRMLVDAAGSRGFVKGHGFGELKKHGVDVHAVLPVNILRHKLSRIDMRNHRKIAIVDGKVAYVGSHNVVEEHYGGQDDMKWVDLSGRYEGPIVWQMQRVFLDDWVFQTQKQLDEMGLFPDAKKVGGVSAQVVPTGPNYEAETFRRVLIAALNSAQHRIVMTTPYFVPDEPTVLALSMAADRDVDVRLVVPKDNNHPMVKLAGEYYYDYLLNSGIKIHQFENGLLHSKTVTVDDAFGLMGSANIDMRSFHLNFEVNVLMYGKDVTQRLRDEQKTYMTYSTLIHLDHWRDRSNWRQFGEAVCSLCSPLL
ncbi:Cardiolipin synthase [Poriferisphaera corsica]|uniref:Cardiolipin synthase n=1 Tax=Poriferisphaera corsica TaxID=2528020 RepID=A0A517YY06_9BACT|nr:cardiolipin synthase [Poriferisphaera corsica]QDU35120.1 Cardiolipin synthase [Poriferisphaera corsica]